MGNENKNAEIEIEFRKYFGIGHMEFTHSCTSNFSMLLLVSVHIFRAFAVVTIGDNL